jgi:hypothetical protein
MWDKIQAQTLLVILNVVGVVEEFSLVWTNSIRRLGVLEAQDLSSLEQQKW